MGVTVLSDDAVLCAISAPTSRGYPDLHIFPTFSEIGCLTCDLARSDDRMSVSRAYRQCPGPISLTSNRMSQRSDLAKSRQYGCPRKTIRGGSPGQQFNSCGARRPASVGIKPIRLPRAPVGYLPPKKGAETGGAEQWVLKWRECSGFARVN